MLKMRSSIESGSIVFTVSAFLPFLFFLLSLSFDVYSYYKSVSIEQGNLDAACLLAAKQMPDAARARDVADKYLKKFSRELNNPIPYKGSIEIVTDESKNSVRLTLTGNAPIYFAKLLPLVFQSLSLPSGIPFKLQSSAQTSPRDAVIFVDNSNYLAPSLSSNEIIGWKLRDITGLRYGYLEIFYPTNSIANTTWRAASFFNNFGDVNIYPLNERPRRRLQYTEQCFNPVYSALKDAAIHLYDEISISPLNSVGVFSGPDANGQISRIKPLTAGGFSNGNPEGYLENNNSYRVRDQHCLAAAERASKDLTTWNENNPYTPGENRDFVMPPARLWHAFPSYPAGNLTRIRGFETRDSTFMFTYDDGSIIPGRLDSLTLREALWSRAVNPNRRLNFGRAVNDVVDELLGPSLHSRDIERGGMKDSVRSSAYFILGDMPYIGGARYPVSAAKNALETLLDSVNRRARQAGRQLFLYIVIPRTSHFYTSCDLLVCDQFEEEFDNFQDQVRPYALGQYGSEKEREKWRYLTVIPIRAPDPGSIAEDLMAHLPLSGKGTVLINKEA